MRLKRHRQDVETLNHLAVSGRIRLTTMSIAGRYKRMILAMESRFNEKASVSDVLKTMRLEREVRKDAEVEK